MGALLGISDLPSIPRFLPIPLIRPPRGISHHAQGKRILIPEGGHDPEDQQGRGYGSHIGTVNALLTPWQKFPRTPPPVVQNHIPDTRNHSSENFRKI